MTLPSDGKTRLIIADDVRKEFGGKITILGAFPGPSISVGMVPGVQPVIDSLCFLWWFTDGQGQFTSEMFVQDPNGIEIIRMPPASVIKNADGDMNFVIKMTPFPIVFGTYRIGITLDAQLYERRIKFVSA
jgi:hypothetical protein